MNNQIESEIVNYININGYGMTVLFNGAASNRKIFNNVTHISYSAEEIVLESKIHRKRVVISNKEVNNYIVYPSVCRHSDFDR